VAEQDSQETGGKQSWMDHHTLLQSLPLPVVQAEHSWQFVVGLIHASLKVILFSGR